jgi:CubicO group peptidase (beta-lactamase class C family)
VRGALNRVQGHVAPGFEPVRAAFEANFRTGGELGASLCVYRRGEVIVDLWGGAADAGGRPFEPDTLSLVFSSTKGLVAAAVLMLADRGLLDYDAPVTRYWPEFGQSGKSDITVRTLLNHRAGLCAVDPPLELLDFAMDPDKVAQVCAAQAPRWAPGTDQGYHATTYGMYVGELFRRVAGETVGTFIRREIARPLSADVHLGLPAHLEHRVATTFRARNRDVVLGMLPALAFSGGLEGRVYRQVVRGNTDTAAAFANPGDLGPKGVANLNRRLTRATELPWMGAHCSARGLARVYSALAGDGSLDGARLVRPETLTPLHRRQSWVEMDRVLRKPIGWAQGFVKEETRLFSPNEASFGHPGAGGPLGWADPVEGLGIGYVMNRMSHYVRSPRAVALCHALYRCL